MESTFMDLLFQGHRLTRCPFSREPSGGPGSQLSLETNMDRWADSLTAQLQEGGTARLMRLNDGLGGGLGRGFDEGPGALNHCDL